MFLFEHIYEKKYMSDRAIQMPIEIRRLPDLVFFKKTSNSSREQ